MNKMKNMQGSRDIKKSPVKYIDQDQSRNVHSRLRTFEVQEH